MKELLLFQAGNIEFGLNLPLVNSIHNVNARFAEQAGRSHKLVQVMDGEEFPLYDLPSILADEISSGDPMSQKVIMVEAHEHPIALGVDRVKQVVSVSSDCIHPLPLIFNGSSLSCFPWVLKHEDALILLLNPEEIENLEPKIPNTETDTQKPEVTKSSFEEKIPSSFAKKELAVREELFQKEPLQPPESILSDGHEQVEPELSVIDASLEDMTSNIEDSDAHDTVEKAAVTDVDETAPETSKEPFQSEENILSDEQENVEPELSALDASLEDMIPGTEDSDAHDTEVKAPVTDIDDFATETSPVKEITEMDMEGSHFETASANPATESYDELPCETQPEEEKDEVNEEIRLISSIGISIDSQDESGSPMEEVKPVSGDVLSQLPAGQPDEIVSLKETENAVEPQELKSTDPFRSVKVDKDKPLLPVGEVPYLFAAISTESEPIQTEPAEEVSLKEAEAMVETLEEESTDSFRSVKVDKDKPLLPVGEVPYLFAAISTESEPIQTEPAEEVSLKESEAEVEVPDPESTDHFGSAEEDTATLIMPVREGPSLLDDASIESEQIIKEPSHAILLDSSDIVMPESADRSENILAPTRLPIELVIDDGKQKGSYRGRVTATVLALVAILLLSIWLLPKSSLKVSEVVRKPIPMAYAVQEVSEKSPELLQTAQPSNTGEKASAIEYKSEKAGEEVFKIETDDFTLTVERPKSTDQKDRPPTSTGITGENEYSHIVVKDDTLWQIAERYLDDPFRYPELAEKSRISNPDRIYPGDVVRIITKNEPQEERKGNLSQERSKDGNR